MHGFPNEGGRDAAPLTSSSRFCMCNPTHPTSQHSLDHDAGTPDCLDHDPDCVQVMGFVVNHLKSCIDF